MSDVRFFDPDRSVLTHPAAVRARGVEMDAPRLLALARSRRAIDPEALDEFPPFFFPAEISSSRLDAYSTRMRRSSLENYAREAEEGVALMVAHQTRSTMPLGGSLTGQFVGGQGNGVARVRADFYTVPGLEGGVISSDQLIRGLRTGVYTDVSIGFFGGRYVCSIDGLDIFRDWRECPHIPGVEYDVPGGGEVRREVCVADIEDAHLAEVSAVYDGATPGASVLKAIQEAEGGRMKPETARMIQARYRHLDLSALSSATRRFFPGHDGGNNTEETTDMSDRAGQRTDQAPTAAPPPPADGQRETPPPAAQPPQQDHSARQLAAVASVLDEAQVPAGDDLAARARALVARAREGTAYRQRVIDAALAEGVRAHGAESFDSDAYRRSFEGMTADQIDLIRAGFERAASSTFQGGRQTTDGEDEGGEQAQQAVAIPSRVFGG